MNYRLVARVLSMSLLTEAALLLLPVGIAIYYGESPAPFLLTILALVVTAGPLRLCKVRSRDFYAREGFASVSLSWIALSAYGALPFIFAGVIPSFVDALFETVSGFTTTGASILSHVEGLPMGILFWRSFTHWIGGMGILVFVLAVLPAVEERSIHIMRAEVPGPQVSKLVPRTRNTAAILYCIYLAMTVLLILLLVLGDMPLFDAAVHAFGAAGTGGFGIKNTSIGWYDSAYVDVVIGIFMILFSMNFNLYFFLLLGQVKDFFKNEELRWYLCIIAAAVLLIAWNISSVYGSKSLLYSFFQVSSIISTTGYATTDFSLWPEVLPVYVAVRHVYRRLRRRYRRRHQGEPGHYPGEIRWKRNPSLTASSLHTPGHNGSKARLGFCGPWHDGVFFLIYRHYYDLRAAACPG